MLFCLFVFCPWRGLFQGATGKLVLFFISLVKSRAAETKAEGCPVK
jgi:hypothetical protein